jgi:hypothetical protein
MLPFDPALEKAAWRGELAAPGPFTKAVEDLAAVVLPRAARTASSPVRRRRAVRPV